MAVVLIFYDISDDKKRTEIANLLKNFGMDRIQYSGFIGDLSSDELQELEQRLSSKITPGEDIAHIIMLNKCGQVRTIGALDWAEEEVYVL